MLQFEILQTLLHGTCTMHHIEGVMLCDVCAVTYMQIVNVVKLQMTRCNLSSVRFVSHTCKLCDM